MSTDFLIEAVIFIKYIYIFSLIDNYASLAKKTP